MPRTHVFVIGGTVAVKPVSGPILYNELKTALVRMLAALKVEASVELFYLRLLGFGSIEKSVERLHGEMLKAVAPDDRIVLVGHSQGGLIVADLAARDRRVVLAVAIAAPFQGSLTCTPITAGIVPAFWNMAPGSRYLSRLCRSLPPIAGRLVTIRALTDLVVWPSENCATGIDGVEDIVIDANHLTIVAHRDTLEHLNRLLERALVQKPVASNQASRRPRAGRPARRGMVRAS